MARTKKEIPCFVEKNANLALAQLSEKYLCDKNISIKDFSIALLKWAKKLTESEFGFAGYIDENGYLVAPTLTEDVWKKCEVKNKSTVFKELAGIWGWVLKNKKPVLANNLAKDRRYVGVPNGHVKIEKFLAVPAILKKKLIGIIAVANAKKGYARKDFFNIKTLANFYAIALEKKKRENEIKENERKFRLFLDTSPEIIYSIDKQGIVKHINKTVRKYGYKEKDIIGKEAKNFCFKDDLPIVYEALKKSFETGKTEETLNFRMIRKNGEPFYVAQKSNILRKSGKPYLINCFARDISVKVGMETKLKKSELMIQTILDTAEDIIFVKDLKSRYVKINEACGKFFNISPKKINGETDFDFFPPDMAKESMHYDRIVFETGKPFISDDKRKTAKGEKIFNVIKTPLKNEKGKIIGLLGIARDITRVKKLEEELIHRRAIEEANKITGSAAHDFNNVLAAVNGYAMLMLEDIDRKNPMRREIAAIVKAVERAVKITEKLQPKN